MKKFSVVIDRFEGEKAILKLEDGQTLIIPIDYLPEEATEGSIISLSFGQPAEETEARQAQAKALLNEILKNQD